MAGTAPVTSPGAGKEVARPHTQRWYDPAKEESHGVCNRIHIYRLAH